MVYPNLTRVLAMSAVDQSYLGLAAFTALLSILGCVVVILTYITIRGKRTMGRKVLVYISVCNLGSCIGTLMAIGNDVTFDEVSWRSYPTCEAAGAISIVCNMGGYLWTSTLAIFLYLSICWKRDVAKTVMWPAHVICWGFPGNMSIFMPPPLSKNEGQIDLHNFMSVGM